MNRTVSDLPQIINDDMLNQSSFFRGSLRLYFYLRLYKQRRKAIKDRKALERAIKTIYTEYNNSISNGAKRNMKIFNSAMYMLIVRYDVSCIAIMLLNQIDRWNKSILTRKVIILMHEATHDFFKLFGKNFREMLKTLPKSEEITSSLKLISKELNTFKDKHSSFLHEVRNNCGAHRDKTAFKQLNTMNKIDTLETLRILGEFQKITEKMIPFSSAVIDLLILDEKGRKLEIINHLRENPEQLQKVDNAN